VATVALGRAMFPGVLSLHQDVKRWKEAPVPYRPPIHRPPGWKPAPKQENPDHARYRTVAWRAIRQFVLIRDNYTCQLRLPGCTTAANTADHVIEVRAGGSDNPSNLRAVCPACHNARHADKGRWDRS
jgi:5-methylcytosine-specific restriction enzyme A